jgi:uncharacterized protein YdhG (YjbR/CyaY superfamily)
MDMQTSESDFTTIPEYIARFPEQVRGILEELRRVIKETAPEAEEAISWGMPTFRLHGNLVHFAGYKHHIGFYPGSSAIDAFREELPPYKHSKGTLQFPIDKPVPFDLVRKIVRYRVKENSEKQK